MKIVKIEPSDVQNKRYRVILNDGKMYNFGLHDGNTYIDHHNIKLRDAYQKRHLGNKIEKTTSNLKSGKTLSHITLAVSVL